METWHLKPAKEFKKEKLLLLSLISNMEVGHGVTPACNPVIPEFEAEGSLQV